MTISMITVLPTLPADEAPHHTFPQLAGLQAKCDELKGVSAQLTLLQQQASAIQRQVSPGISRCITSQAVPRDISTALFRRPSSPVGTASPGRPASSITVPVKAKSSALLPTTPRQPPLSPTSTPVLTARQISPSRKSWSTLSPQPMVPLSRSGSVTLPVAAAQTPRVPVPMRQISPPTTSRSVLRESSPSLSVSIPRMTPTPTQQVVVAAPCAAPCSLKQKLSTTADAYQVDPTDLMDRRFLSELKNLDKEAASRLRVARDRPGQYYIDGRYIRLHWSDEEDGELLVRELGINDSGVTTSLASYLRQVANVHVSLHGRLEGRVPAISRVPKPCRMTFLNTGTDTHATLHNVDNSERVRWMKLACEQASLREVHAGGTKRRTYKL